LKSCEQAVREYVQAAQPSTVPKATPAPPSRYGDVLNRGTYFAHCPVPDSAEIRICAAIQDGQPLGVTVSTVPALAEAEDCIASGVAGLRFPPSPGVDVVRTQF